MLKTLDKPRKAQVQTELVTVTPEMAAQWLTTNNANRRPQSRFVRQFARDMSAGSWAITGDSIKFDADATLIDGQHRLMACVEAQHAFTTFVIYGLPATTRDVIDTGKARTLGDVLQMRSIPNASAVASTVKLLINQSRGHSNIGGSGTVTHSEMVRALEKHHRLPLYVLLPRDLPRGISVPLVSYVSYVGATLQKERERAEAMVAVMRSGAPDYEGDPIHMYRERIIMNYAEAIGSIRNRESNIWTFKHCWNLFLHRKPIDRLRWRQSDVDIEGLDLSKL